MSIVLSLLQGKNRRYLSHVRRTLVWGLKSRRKSTETELAQPHLLQRGVELNAKRWMFLGMSKGLLSLHYPLACPFKGMFSSNGSLPAETCPHLLLGVMKTCRRTRREEGFCRRFLSGFCHLEQPPPPCSLHSIQSS